MRLSRNIILACDEEGGRKVEGGTIRFDSSGAADGHATLKPAERLLVWAFRRWAVGFRDNCCHQWALVWREFRREFGAADGERALAAFAALFKQLMIHGRRTIHYHQPCCPCLGADEAWLVSFVAACQHGSWPRAQTLAEAMVEAEGAGDLLEAGGALAKRMRAGSLILSLPDADAPGSAYSGTIH